MPVGQILVETNMITPAQLEEALAVQKQEPGRRIGDILISKGHITEVQLYKALEYRFKVPFVELSPASIPQELAKVVSEELARKYMLVPVSHEGGELTIAMADPMNLYALDDVAFQTKLQLKTVMATRSNIERAIGTLYSQSKAKEAVQSLNEEFSAEDVERLSEEIGDDVDNAPVVRLVNTIIQQGVASEASDIHIEPLEKTVRIRMRLDGELTERMTITKSAHNAVVTRLKIMGNMNIAEKRLPQDGRIDIVVGGRPVDLRVSVLPTVTGEKVVIRILGGQGRSMTYDSLGFSEQNRKLFDSIIQSPNGILLVSGPTGSGKTTTLYTVISELNRPNLNIITVEDPVEFRMEGVNQVQINEKAGMHFSTGLRSILRQDPDVIMVGEIRDGETAEIAVRAAITGHLVLSTIHTNNAAATIHRLVDMGVEPFFVSASLVGVVAQRLVRRLCPRCKKPYRPEHNEMMLLRLTQPTTLYRPDGCDYCNGTGYKGRLAIHEILAVNKEIRELIDRRASIDQLHQCAQRFGTVSLRDCCADLVMKGETSVEQLVRVTYSIN